MKTVYLKNNKESVLQEALKRNTLSSSYSRQEIIEAIDFCISEELRYNKAKGKTLNKSLGVVSEYVHKKDIEKYESDEQAAIWEFTGFIRNEAFRKKNNYRK